MIFLLIIITIALVVIAVRLEDAVYYLEKLFYATRSIDDKIPPE